MFLLIRAALLMVEGQKSAICMVLPWQASLHKLPMAVVENSAMPFLHGRHLATLDTGQKFELYCANRKT
jgi:hypothetical protein